MSLTDDLYGRIAATSGPLKNSDPFLSILSSRSQTGKSMTLKALKKRITGIDPGLVLIDEFGPPLVEKFSAARTTHPLGDLLGEFKDPDFPECTVYASIVRIGKRDPRNPNPAAGAVRRFYITRDGYQEPVKNKTTAITKARIVHERLVAEAKAKIAEEAWRNKEHLQALPAYGEF